MRARSVLALLLALALAVAACGGDDDEAKAKPKPKPKPTTTTTAAPEPVSPLTGLPQADEARRNRVALAVKLDNAPKGRPQAGLNQADLVVEEKVEDGVTRLFVLFQSTDADSVGAVRSARSTDINLLTPLNRPLFAYSGTNGGFQQLVNAAPIVDVGIDHAGDAYHREGGRPAPYNLFTSTAALYGHAPPESGPPPQLFTYAPAPAAGAAPATSARVTYPGAHITTVADWSWDPASGRWLRVQDGTPHVDAAGVQVSAVNVVIQVVDYVDTGFVDQSGTVVPEAGLIGSGEAFVLTGGTVVHGTWAKPSPEAVTTWTADDGKPMTLVPGQTWIELSPPGGAQVGSAPPV